MDIRKTINLWWSGKLRGLLAFELIWYDITALHSLDSVRHAFLNSCGGISLELPVCGFIEHVQHLLLIVTPIHDTVEFPLSAGKMMMLSSFLRFEIARLRPLSIFWSGSLATCNALLTSFLSLLSSSHINCLHVASVAAMMALYDTHHDTMVNLSPRDRTSCSFHERGLLLRFFYTFDVSVLGGCCLDLRFSNLRFCVSLVRAAMFSALPGTILQ